MAEKISLTIDGTSVEVNEGVTVLEAAQQAGIYIPTLCYHPALKPSGSCKLCAVEVENMGDRNLVMLSCVLKVKEGMVIRTTGDAVQQARVRAFKRLIQMAPQAQRLHDLAESSVLTIDGWLLAVLIRATNTPCKTTKCRCPF